MRPSSLQHLILPRYLRRSLTHIAMSYWRCTVPGIVTSGLQLFPCVWYENAGGAARFILCEFTWFHTWTRPFTSPLWARRQSYKNCVTRRLSNIWPSRHWLSVSIPFRLYLTIYTLTCFQFWVYDLVLGLPQEVRMLKRCKLTLPDVVYYISR